MERYIDAGKTLATIAAVTIELGRRFRAEDPQLSIANERNELI